VFVGIRVSSPSTASPAETEASVVATWISIPRRRNSAAA
jgi:hypothetical protein